MCKSLFIKIIYFIAKLISKSYYLTQIARWVVQIYDNDQNGNMETNGEILLQSLISKQTNENGVFIDVGANIGDWSVSLIGNGFKGRLIVIDPLSGNLLEVKKRLDIISKDKRNFTFFEYALSDKKEIIKFFVNKDKSLGGHDSLFDMKQIGYVDETNSIEVESITLDELAIMSKISRINFLKIDVEGAELQVLKGASMMLQQGNIDFIQIEFGHAARASRTYLHDIVNFIDEFRFKIFVIKPKGFLPLKFSPFIENRYSCVNLLIARNDALSNLKDYILKR